MNSDEVTDIDRHSLCFSFFSMGCSWKAVDCTLVTPTSRLPKQCKTWLEDASAVHHAMRAGDLQRRERERERESCRFRPIPYFFGGIKC